jgi:anti-sigma factor RsiW
MTDHLSPAALNSFVDRELSAEQVARATEHLAGCPSCAAALLLVSVSIVVTQRSVQRMALASVESDLLSLVSEVKA